MRKSSILFVTVIIAASALAGFASPQQPNIPGTWSFWVEVGSTHGEPTFVFEQNGQKLTGTVTNAVGSQKVVGSITGNKVVFGFQAVRDDRTLKASYEGTVASA